MPLARLCALSYESSEPSLAEHEPDIEPGLDRVRKQMATKTLYVGNLPYSSSESDLLDHFSAYNASKARIVEGRGFGFVDIDEEMLETAISEKHDSDMNGRKLTVNEARPRVSGGNRDFGGGYGGGYGGEGGYGNDRRTSGDRRGGGKPSRDRY